MTRVLICGGRDYSDWQHMFAVLSALHEKHRFSLVIEGGASGADAGGRAFGERAGIPVSTFKARWSDLSHSDAVIRTRRDGSKYDAKAGHRRNQLMLDDGRPDLVVAFPGGKGTADMANRATAAGVKLVVIPPYSHGGGGRG